MWQLDALQKTVQVTQCSSSAQTASSVQFRPRVGFGSEDQDCLTSSIGSSMIDWTHSTLEFTKCHPILDLWLSVARIFT